MVAGICQFADDEAQMKAIGDAMAATDAYLFGRKTYEIMAAHWPNQPDTDMFAAVLNPRPKYVVSRDAARAARLAELHPHQR